ncbi:MAG: hypothetical protein ACOYI2_02760 [Bacillota bacterium]|jgi:hypothetical protein|nr:hypothetical protein [Clostridia bacterium]
MHINIFDSFWALLNLIILIAIPGGIIYGIISLIRYLRKLSQKLDRIEKKLNSIIEKIS